MICTEVKQLVNYALKSGIITECDVNYAINALLAQLRLDAYEDSECTEEDELD